MLYMGGCGLVLLLDGGEHVRDGVVSFGQVAGADLELASEFVEMLLMGAVFSLKWVVIVLQLPDHAI